MVDLYGLDMIYGYDMDRTWFIKAYPTYLVIRYKKNKRNGVSRNPQWETITMIHDDTIDLDRRGVK